MEHISLWNGITVHCHVRPRVGCHHALSSPPGDIALVADQDVNELSVAEKFHIDTRAESKETRLHLLLLVGSVAVVLCIFPKICHRLFQRTNGRSLHEWLDVTDVKVDQDLFKCYETI